MSDIFISYASEDRGRVAPIVAALEGNGWSVWWDRELKPGPSFDREIEKAIDNCGCVVVVWSKHSVESEWVRTEASEGAERQILVPVLLDDVRPPLAFRYRQAADLSNRTAIDMDHEFRQFVAAVAETLATPPPLAGHIHGYQPAPPAKTPRKLRFGVIGAIAVAVLGLGAGLLYFLIDPGSGGKDDRVAIAVLPFEYRGSDQGDYFADGLTDALIAALSATPELRVASSTSSFYFKGKSLPLQEVADALLVRYILEGSVRRADNEFRVNLRVVDVGSGSSVWDKQMVRDVQDVLDVQESIAREVATSIVPTLQPEAVIVPQRGTNDTVALDHYLKGRSFLRQRGVGDQFARAIAEFEQANRRDPNFAEAHAGRCDAYLSRYRRSRNELDFVQAESACYRALTLQKPGSSIWQVHTALGELYLEAGQTEKAKTELELANRLHPNSAEVLRHLGHALAAAGATRQAEQTFRQAVMLEPTFWAARVSLGNFLYETGRYDESASVMQQILEVAPDYAGALIGLGSAEFMMGERAAAARTWERAEAVMTPSERGSLAVLNSNLGLGYYYELDFDNAIASQRKATQLAPDDHRFWGRLAESYRGAQQPELEYQTYLEAIRLAERQLSLNPTDWETLGLLGLYYGFTDDSGMSRRYAEQMLQADPANPTAHYFNALIHLSQDDVDGTYAALDAALELGFSREMINKDPDLRSLRQRDPARFDTLFVD